MPISQQSPWQTRVPRIKRAQHHWLTDADSLTLKLKRHCRDFQVLRTHQGKQPSYPDDLRALGLTQTQYLMARNVILCCDKQPTVFGHTITPLARLTRDWHFFNGLGQQALGLALFVNPLIQRQTFEFTRLVKHDRLYQATVAALQQCGFNTGMPPHLWARRCIFTHLRHPESRMMVAEVMLPAIEQLTELRHSLHHEYR